MLHILGGISRVRNGTPTIVSGTKEGSPSPRKYADNCGLQRGTSSIFSALSCYFKF
uniref:Uncharacterized protein n=1 Tax=Triticum urartu TaxID=4572 RepID=A0A8R7QEW4_TRIUA